MPLHSLSACTPPHVYMYMYGEAVEKGQADQVEAYVSIRERDVSGYVERDVSASVEKGQAHLVERSYTSSLRPHTPVA